MDYSGWLYKQSPTGLKQWQKRWFSYNETTKCLDYKKSPNDTTILGYISLPEVSLVGPSIQVHDKKVGDCGFTIDTQVRIYYLSAEAPSEKEKWISWLQKLKGPQKITMGPASPKTPANQPKTPTPTRDSSLTSSNGPGSAQTSPASRKGTIGNGVPPLQRRLSNVSNTGGTASPATPERVQIGAKGQRLSTQLSAVNPNSNDVKPQLDASKLDEENKQLKRENEKLQGEIAQLTTSNVNLQTDLLHANTDSTSKSLEAVSLNQELEEMKVKIGFEKENYNVLKRDYDTAKKQLADLISSNGGAKDEQVAALIEQLRHQETSFNKKLEDSTNTFNNTLKEKSGQIEILERQLNTINSESIATNENYKSRVEELELSNKKQELSITHLQNQLDQKTIKVKDLDTKLQESITENLAMSMKMEQSEKLLKEQTERNNDLLGMIEKHRDELLEHKNNAARLENIVKKTEQEKLDAMTKVAGDNERAQQIVQLTSELDTTRSALQEKESNYHGLEQKLHGVEVELNKLKQEHNTSLESLQKEVGQRDDQLATIQAQFKEIETKLGDSETKLADQQLVTKQIEAERDQKIKDVEHLKQELQTKFKEVNDKVHEYETKFNQQQSLLKQVESGQDQKTTELEYLKQEHNAKLQEISVKLSESESKVKTQQDLINRVESDHDLKIKELETLKQDLQTTLNETNAKLIEAEGKLEQQQATVAQLEGDRDLKSKELDALKQELKTLHENASSTSTLNENSDSQREEEWQAKLKAETTKSAQLQDDLNKFQRDFGILKSKLEKVKQQILLEKQLRTELDLENTTFKSMVDELEVKNKDYEKLIEELSKQKPVENTAMPTSSDNSELAEQFKEMQQLYEAESRRVQKLEEQNQSLQNEVIDLQENQLRNLNVDNLQMKDQLTTTEEKVRELTDKYEDTNRIMEQLVTNSEALEKDNKHLQKQNQSLSKQLHEAEEKAKKAAPSPDANKADEVATLREENNSLSSTITSLTEQVSSTQSELRSASEERDLLNGQLKHLQEQLASYENSQTDAARDLQQQLQRVNAEKDKLQDEFNQLKENVGANDAVVEQLKSAKAALEHDIKSLQDTLSTIESSQDSAAAELKQELERSAEEKNKLQDDIKLINESLVSNTALIEQLNSDKSTLEQNLKVLQDKISSNEASQDDVTASLQQQLEQVTGERTKLHDEIMQLKENIDANNMLVEKMNGDKTALENELKALQTSFEAQQKDKEAADAEKESLKTELEQVTKSSTGIGDLVEKLNVERAELEQRVKNLQEEHEKLQKRLEELDTEKSTVQEELDNFKTTHQEVNVTLEDVKAAKETLEEELNSLKASVAQSSANNEENAKLGAELSTARDQVESLTAQLRIATVQLTTMENDLITLKVTHESELQTTKETFNEQKELLQKEIQNLQRLSLNASGSQLRIGASRGSIDITPDQTTKLAEQLQNSIQLLEDTKKQHSEQVAQLTSDLQAVRDELATLKSAPVVEAAPDNTAELQLELDGLKEKLGQATVRHDEFVKATKEEREKFDAEVKKLTALVTEERKRVEIKNLEIQAIKLETSNFELENEKQTKQIASLVEDNNNLKARVSHLENLRRSSGGLDAKTDLNYSEENFEFLKEEHAKLRHQIAQYQQLMTMEHDLQAQIATLQQELMSARNALHSQQERFEKEKHNLLFSYATEKQTLMRRLTESGEPGSSTPTLTPTLVRRTSDAGETPSSPYLVRRPDFDSPSTPIMTRQTIAYETSPMSLSYGGSFDHMSFMSSPGPDRQREEQLARQNDELKKHIKSELMLKKEVDDLKLLFAQTLQKVKKSEEEKSKTINGYVKEIEELKKQTKAEGSIKAELAELKENYQQTLQLLRKNKEIEQKNHHTFHQMVQKTELIAKENNDLKAKLELSVTEIESYKAKLQLLRNEYKKLQAQLAQQSASNSSAQ